jgi:hypothetical protein
MTEDFEVGWPDAPHRVLPGQASAASRASSRRADIVADLCSLL